MDYMTLKEASEKWQVFVYPQRTKPSPPIDDIRGRKERRNENISCRR